MSFDTAGALKAGYSQDEINQYLASQGGQSTPTPTAPPAQPSGDVASNVGNSTINFLKGLLGSVTQPFTNATNSVVQANSQPLPNAKGNLLQSLKNALTETGNFATKGVFNPQADLSAASYAVPFGKAAPAAEAIANPIIKTLANLATKAVIPGAVAGGLQGAGQQGATPASVVGNAELGAGGAGLLHSILGIPGLLGGTGKAVEGAGNALTQDVNKIQLTPSVYGASQEKAVQNTVNQIPGLTAAQKYENLQPMMGKLGDYIQNELDTNPKTVPIEQVKNDFMGNLQDQLRTKNLTSSTAQNEIDGYLKDLYSHAKGGESASNAAPDSVPTGGSSRLIVNDQGVASPEFAVPNGKTPNNPEASTNALPKDISTSDLFKLKQQINQDYQGVAKKLQNGTPLNDREKVIAAGRQTLDDIIAEQHPNIKQATKMQSNLYDAAEPLAKSRNADHSIPIFSKGGIGIPSDVVQGGKTILGKGIQATGQALQSGNGVGDITSNPIVRQLLGMASAQLPVLGTQNTVNNSQNQQSNPENPGGQETPNSSSQNQENVQNNTNYTPNGTSQHAGSVSQSSSNFNNDYTPPSPDQYAAIVNGVDSSTAITRKQVIAASLALPAQLSDRIKAAYDAQQGDQTTQQLGLAKHNADNALTSLENSYFNGGLSSGRALGQLNDEYAKYFGKNPNLQTYNAAREAIAPVLAKAFGDVGNVSQAKLEAAAKLLPTASSTPQEAAQGFAQMRTFLGLQQRK